VWTKFRNFLFWKKVKSPLSMNFGRISTSKCRSKLQKMGVLYTHSPKSPGPFSKLPKIHFFLIKKFQKNWDSLTGAGVGPWPTGDQWVDTYACWVVPIFLEFFFFMPSTFCTSGQLSLIGCNTCPPCPDFSLKLQTSITFDP
jgi:hypothetical protein